MRYILIALLVAGLGMNMAFAGDGHRGSRGRKPNHHRDYRRGNKDQKLVFGIGSLAIRLAQTIVENAKDKDDDKLYVYDENGKLKAIIDKDDLKATKCKKEERKVVIYQWPRMEFRRDQWKPMPRHHKTRHHRRCR